MRKFFLIGATVLFALLGSVALIKKMTSRPVVQAAAVEQPSAVQPIAETPVVSVPVAIDSIVARPVASSDDDFPQIDRIFQLFTLGSTKFPIVESVTYCSSVPWLKGRPAWLSDYAAHYNTSRHFIARSLNGKSDYFSQKVSEGSRFNVFRTDKHMQFYLLVDFRAARWAFIMST